MRTISVPASILTLFVLLLAGCGSSAPASPASPASNQAASEAAPSGDATIESSSAPFPSLVETPDGSGSGGVPTLPPLAAEKAPASPAVPGSFVVDSAEDTVDASPGDGACADSSGQCSLRAAIMETNALEGANHITLGAGRCVLAIGGVGEDVGMTGDLDITDDLTIAGSGRATTVIDGAGLDRVIDIHREAVVAISDLTVKNGNAADEGGGIRVRMDRFDGGGLHAPTLSLTRVVISGNSAPTGGGLWTWGNVGLIDSTVTGNESLNTQGHGGGGIANQNRARLNIVNSTISGNTSATFGGGIYNLGFLDIFGSTISENEAGSGGGVYIKTSSIDIINTLISDNSAKFFGGGIHVSNGVLDLTDSIVRGNIAPGGGGLANSDGSTTVVDNVLISENSADRLGGGIYNNGEHLAVRNSEIRRNYANDGGGIFNSNERDCDDPTNVNYSDCGGRLSGTRTLEIVNTLVVYNTANQSGGGIYSLNGIVRIFDSVVNENHAEDDGGGIATRKGATDLFNSRVNNNPSLFGGGIDNFEGTMEVKNTQVTGNSAGLGGGVFNSGSIKMIDSDLKGNSSTDDMGDDAVNFGEVGLIRYFESRGGFKKLPPIPEGFVLPTPGPTP